MTLNITNHPIWEKGSLWGKVTPFKRKLHIGRFFLAKLYAQTLPREMFVGITGSVGKTTTSLACKTVLESHFSTISTLETNRQTANLDPVFNLPMTILRIRPTTKKVVLEMGIEYKGEMGLWLQLVKPGTGIVTSIGLAHSEFLGSKDDIAQEKGKLIEQLPKNGYAILCYDDPVVRRMADRTKARVVYFGTDEKNCDVWASNIRLKEYRMVFELNYGVERVEVESQILGEHQIYPLLAAAALGVTCDIPLTTIKKYLEKVKPAPHRLQAIMGVNGSTVLDDTYNAAPNAVEQALETLNRLPAKRRIAVLGAMKELGPQSKKMHQMIAQKIFKDKVDIVLLGKSEAEMIAEELLSLGFKKDRLHANLDNEEMSVQLLKILGKGDVVLVKGARSNKLEEVVDKITAK